MRARVRVHVCVCVILYKRPCGRFYETGQIDHVYDLLNTQVHACFVQLENNA